LPWPSRKAGITGGSRLIFPPTSDADFPNILLIIH
jgi:hypothetical protein